MRSLDHIVGIVDGKGGRFPPWTGGMAAAAIVGQVQGLVVRVCGLVIVVAVATGTSVRGGRIISVMTSPAFYTCMRSGQGVIVVVYRKGCRFPARCGSMTIAAGFGDIS
jgi:hypothetical protein